MTTLYPTLLGDSSETPGYWTEAAILDFTDELSRLMAEHGVNRAELAHRLGTSPAYITKVLQGNANFTVGTMTKLARALDHEVRIRLAPANSTMSWAARPSNPAEEGSSVIDVTFPGGKARAPVAAVSVSDADGKRVGATNG